MKRIAILLTCWFLSLNMALANSALWQLQPTNISYSGTRTIFPNTYTVFALNTEEMSTRLQAAHTAPTTLLLPNPDGKFISLTIERSCVMHPELELKYPMIRAFKGYGAKGEFIQARIEFTTSGFHALVNTPAGIYSIEPMSNAVGNNWYQVFYKKDYPLEKHRAMICELSSNNDAPELDWENSALTATAQRVHGNELRTYRLALACTYEYAVAVAGPSPTKAAVLSAMVTSINRVSGIYEKEVAVRFELIPNNDTLIFNDNASSDPYTNNSGGTMLSENQNTVTARIGSANYDIGHVFSTGGGGIAQLACVCSNNNKARGVTGSFNPVGDPFDVDYVAHEMGHQFGAQHTFNAASGSCAGNGSSGSAYEPGSGATIMAYAGICGGADNLQSNSDPYFHLRSLNQITNFITTGNGNNCPVKTSLDNTIPDVAPFDAVYHIPSLTPFELSGPPANDTDHTELMYSWEQFDLGDYGKSISNTFLGPIIRSYNPDTANYRMVPRLNRLLVNQMNFRGEKVPDISRELNFKLIVRDVKNGIGSHNVLNDVIKLQVHHIDEPFAITYPNSPLNELPVNKDNTIYWSLGGSDVAPISCEKVSIHLSVDGGHTWPYTLADSTENDGMATVFIPNLPLTHLARIKIRSIGNVFFDISNFNFRLVDSTSSNIKERETLAGNIILAPNPATETVSLSLPIHLNRSFDVHLMDITGKTIWKKHTKDSMMFSVSHLANGVYFIKVTAANGSIEVVKLQVAH